MEPTKLPNSIDGIRSFRFLNEGDPEPVDYEFAIVISRYLGKWVLVRHRERNTWEIPAGHVESGETVLEAAHRELFEETGAIEYLLTPLVSYEGDYFGKMVNGKIFVAEITKFQQLPESEIAEKRFFAAIPENLTYPGIQPMMIDFYLNR